MKPWRSSQNYLKIMRNGSEDIRRSTDVIVKYWKDNSTNCTTTTPTFPCENVRSYIYFFERERLIHLQGNDSNTFLHRTLTKTSNKSMLNDQTSLTTLWCVGTLSTSVFYLYINEWRLEDNVWRLYNLQVPNLCQIYYASNTLISFYS